MGLSIVDKINEKTGKSAQTIAQAVENLELGGGGGTTFIVHAIKVDSGNWFGLRLDKTCSEIINAAQSGSIVYLLQTPVDGILTAHAIRMLADISYEDKENEGDPYRNYTFRFGNEMDFTYYTNYSPADPYPYEGEYPFADYS